jgi:hypothetical protein
MACIVTPDEWAAGGLCSRTLSSVRAQVHQHGCAVIHDAVPASVCDLLALPLYADSQRTLESGFWPPQRDCCRRGGVLEGDGHVHLGAPRCSPWVHEDVVANPIVEQCVAALIGSGAMLDAYTGVCGLVGCGTQPLHMHAPWLWTSESDAADAGQMWPPPAQELVVCLAIEHVDAANVTTLSPASSQPH